MRKKGHIHQHGGSPQEIFYQDPRLPWFECRRSTGSSRTFRPHLHHCFSIGAVDRGSVVFTVGTMQATLRHGSLAFINPEVLHSCNTNQQNDTRNFSMLHLQISWCRLVQQSVWDVGDFVPASVTLLDDTSYFQRFYRILRALLSPELTVLEKEELLGEFMTDLFPRICSPQPNRVCLPADIEEMKRQLATSLETDLSLQALADHFQANPYTLLRRFKAETGITPHAYRTNCRIELAKSLLRQGMDIAETALECGFFDQSHLHRHFKAITTVTPREYQINFVQ